ncbi:hypothetical protein AAFF_G00114410 [Aldrovandia affinis]|uniref:Uncharacterized protein n=1 Tax=Aldrovandia affinis TaxID=143900 RepID=A0AAD7RT43_9TELE|nr:hypothetical protein AAFF_G00114410 [Aldrovandia affinis]
MAATTPAPAPAPGEVEDADPRDPKVEACASFALQSLFSEELRRYTITKFHSVKRANIGGGQYDMDVEVRRARTELDEQPDRGSTQTLPPEDQVFRCHFVVLSVPWKNQLVLLHSACTPTATSGSASH